MVLFHKWYHCYGYTMCAPKWEIYVAEEYKNCLISDTGNTLLSLKVAFAFSKGSQFRDLFNHAMHKIVESGELKKIKAKYEVLKPDCDGSKGKPIGFENSAFAFAIFCGGLSFTIILLFLEILLGGRFSTSEFN